MKPKKRKDHGYIRDGADGTLCECEECEPPKRSKELEEIFSEFEVIWHPRGYTSEPPCLSPNEVKEKFKSAIEKWAKERYGR